MTVKLVKMRCYHVKGWKKGTQFRLHEWDETTAKIRRPLSGGIFYEVPIWKLENTLRHKNKLASNQTKGGQSS